MRAPPRPARRTPGNCSSSTNKGPAWIAATKQAPEPTGPQRRYDHKSIRKGDAGQRPPCTVGEHLPQRPYLSSKAIDKRRSVIAVNFRFRHLERSREI